MPAIEVYGQCSINLLLIDWFDEVNRIENWNKKNWKQKEIFESWTKTLSESFVCLRIVI